MELNTEEDAEAFIARQRLSRGSNFREGVVCRWRRAYLDVAGEPKGP